MLYYCIVTANYNEIINGYKNKIMNEYDRKIIDKVRNVESVYKFSMLSVYNFVITSKKLYIKKLINYL